MPPTFVACSTLFVIFAIIPGLRLYQHSTNPGTFRRRHASSCYVHPVATRPSGGYLADYFQDFSCQSILERHKTHRVSRSLFAVHHSPLSNQEPQWGVEPTQRRKHYNNDRPPYLGYSQSRWYYCGSCDRIMDSRHRHCLFCWFGGS